MKEKEKFVSIGFKTSLLVFFLIFVCATLTSVIIFSTTQDTIILSNLFPNILIPIFALCAVLFLASLFFIRRMIVTPLKTLLEVSRDLAEGNTEVVAVNNSHDEIGQLMNHLSKITVSIHNWSQYAQKIAEGDLSKDMIPSSENHRLVNNMRMIINNLSNLSSQVSKIEKQVVEGYLCESRNGDHYSGVYSGIIESVQHMTCSFASILDTFDFSIIIIDKEHKIQFANTKAISGLANRNETIYKKCYDIFGCELDTCKLGDCVKSQKTQSFEEVGTVSKLVLSSNIIPHKDESGNILGVIEVSTDVTELKKVEKVVIKQLDYQKNEIQNLIKNLDHLANGNLSMDFSISESDEDTKEIAENFKMLNCSLVESTESIKQIIEEVADMLSKMANKDLTVGIGREYKGDFIKLKDSINYIVEHFNTILSDINLAAEQVESGADQVASSSQSLSQGASQQASSLEEIGATVTQVADQTKENALNAAKANELSIKAKGDAQQGNIQMQEMLKAMNHIKESSKSISNIIKVIDEIAFQTNILALNAAVEAARAGEHGRGFAVVAEEVRNLAARSAKAAKETTDLIDYSINNVEEGYEIANDTADALDKIVKGVADTVEIVKGIAEASNQQEKAISEIDSSIEQVSAVTQANTATAEESASSSEEMAGQAQMLKNMIQEFKLKHEHNKMIETSQRARMIEHRK